MTADGNDLTFKIEGLFLFRVIEKMDNFIFAIDKSLFVYTAKCV